MRIRSIQHALEMSAAFQAAVARMVPAQPLVREHHVGTPYPAQDLRTERRQSPKVTGLTAPIDSRLLDIAHVAMVEHKGTEDIIAWCADEDLEVTQAQAFNAMCEVAESSERRPARGLELGL